MSHVDPDVPRTPDELEQRQTRDGSYEDGGVYRDVPDRPLTPDEIEQHLDAYDPDDDDEPA
ncbi:hypothetical protein [Egicoccus sp. AB-alg6-2]|uniref:hypothetical protein n=1 Tax=Egicoccus sp. AB-alg6-2 TaxID=3242692 RepID=UPI00359D4F20